MEVSSIFIINMKNVFVTIFIKKKKAVALFLFLLTSILTSYNLKRFELHINNMIAKINDINICCFYLILSWTSILLTKIYPDFVLAIRVSVLANNDFNYCRFTNNFYYFCNSGDDMIIKPKIQKFKFANCINALLYCKIFHVFTDCTLSKKTFISWWGLS